MDEPSLMHMSDASEELHCKTLHLSLGKRPIMTIDTRFQVVVKVLHDHEHLVMLEANNHLLHTHDILVLQREEHLSLQTYVQVMLSWFFVDTVLNISFT
jgi:hypothetical protein